ncbi:MAG: hypothetical protein IPN29_05240 [Saprospiraceae bacterium]|nr:hypothetical protein [Saprospiraceae bacterium]
MKLHFVSREAYRQKEMDSSIADIITQYPNYFLIPEGGSNIHALPGVIEIASEMEQQVADVTHIAVAAGTGYTAAGLLMGLSRHHITAQLMVFSALKGDFLAAVISDLSGITNYNFYFTDEWSLGGYAKVNPTYLQFLAEFESRTHLPVDPVYNGKVLYGLYNLGKRGYFKPTDKVLWIDTGGIQGKAGMEMRYGHQQATMPENQSSP